MKGYSRVALFVVLWALAMPLVWRAWRSGVLFTSQSPILYHAGTLGFNYVEFGAVRRGLGGTLAFWLGSDLLRATVYFHAVSAALVAAAGTWFLARLHRPRAERATSALLIAALLLRWAEDAGRTDLLVAGLLAGAAIAVVKGRPALACAAVAVGLAVHETALIYGLPLLLGLALDGGRWRTGLRRGWLAGGAILLTTLAAYFLLEHLPHADTRSMVDTVRSRLPRHVFVDWAIYFAVSGGRGVRTSLCQNAGDPTWAIHFVTGLALIAIFVELLSWRGGPSRAMAWLVAVPPFLFLNIVANDISRWAVLAAFDVWLLHAARACSPGVDERLPGGTAEHSPTPLTWARCLVAVLVVPLIHPKVWPIADPIFAPMPVVEHLLTSLGGPRTPRFKAALERCDPDWRSVLEGREPSSP